MIFENANERARAIKQMTSTDSFLRMATVTAVSGTTATIRFWGESSASTKTYKRLGSYTPAANDTVLMIKMGGTYIILGKVI